MHHSVKEILENIMLNCPGCNQNFMYVEAFKHVKVCEHIREGKAVSQVDLQKMIATNINVAGDNNQGAIGGLFGGGKLGNQIFVLDREGFNVFVYDTIG